MNSSRFSSIWDMSKYENVLEVKDDGRICIVSLNRPPKHNAMSESMIYGLGYVFESMPDNIRCVVLNGNGKNFCAGLDLSQHKDRAPFESLLFSRSGHKAFEAIRLGNRPVVAALHGAVIGGGFEMAACAHVRVADTTTFFQLPEGRRGIYIGGGGSVRIRRIIGVSRMMEMLLTARKYDADAGERLGIAHYVVPEGTALDRALELADDIAGNATIVNYMITHALSHIDDMSAEDGLFTEAVAQAMSLTSPDAKAGMEAFLNRRKIEF
jgi:enoyl-CoA hydratase/carnithine racemase